MAGQTLPAQPDDHGPIGGDAPSRFGAFAVAGEDGLRRLTLAVEGVHCAGCIGKIESALLEDPAVRQARLNFSTCRLSLAWDGPPEEAERLVRRVTALGYGVTPYDARDRARGDEKEWRFLLLCLGVAGFAAGNIMLLSFALWTTPGEVMGMGTRDLLHRVSSLIALPAVAFSGRPFFRSAWAVLKNGRTNMDVPISVALVLASGMSVFEMLRHGEHVYFDSVVMLMFFLLVGRVLDFRARAGARNAAQGLLSMMAGAATVIGEDGRRQTVAIRDLREGMIVLTGMGERIPADGVVLVGQSEIDMSLATGESLPRPVNSGDSVYSGTMNMAAPLTIRIARAAEDSLLGGIVRLMEQAEQGQARYVRLADRMARLYTPVVHALAALTFLGWLMIGGVAWQESLMVAVTVLIITCPCALGLAVPVVQVLATGRLMKNRVLVKSGDALERLAGTDTVIFDKTGTLTLGRPVLDAETPQDWDKVRLAASLAVHSRHPLSRALAASYDGPLLEVSVTEEPGRGLSARVFVDGQEKFVRLGSRGWCGERTAPVRPDRLELWLDVEGDSPVAFLFFDPLRFDAKETVLALKERGYHVILASGDREEAARRMAEELGIEDWHGGLTPEEKFSLLQTLRISGHKTLMVGDGLNDAPMLAGADASISPASAIDMAQNAADMIVMGEGLATVVEACDTARLAQRLVKQNFMLAVLYNVVAVPLAMAGMVTPLVAAVAMSGSSLVVIANSFRLKRRKG